MIPPPGWVAEPHSQRSRTGRPEPGVAGHRAVEEELLEAELALEDVALGQAEPALDVERGEDLAVEDDVADVRGDLGDPVDDGVAERLAVVVPGPEARVELVRGVLDEAADDVLAGRRHRRVDQGRDDHVDVRPLRPAAVLRVVVGALHVVDAGAEADRAAQVVALAGQAGEVGQPVDRHVDLARRAAELEPADLLLELRVEGPRLDQPEVGQPRVDRAEDRPSPGSPRRPRGRPRRRGRP